LQDFFFYSSSFSQLSRLIILFLLKKLVRTPLSPNRIRSYLSSEKRKPPIIQVRFFKEKEKEGEVRPKAWWPNGRRRRRFLDWWPMEGEGEGSLLGGQ
jgi:hypothetical protein